MVEVVRSAVAVVVRPEADGLSGAPQPHDEPLLLHATRAGSGHQAKRVKPAAIEWPCIRRWNHELATPSSTFGSATASCSRSRARRPGGRDGDDPPKLAGVSA